MFEDTIAKTIVLIFGVWVLKNKLKKSQSTKELKIKLQISGLKNTLNPRS